MTVEGRPVLQAPCALLPHHHDWHAYLPDVYIFLPALTDQTYKINCPFCHDSDGVNAKEFTPGRRTLADGRSYWFIGRRYRCLLCQQLVRERGYNGAGLPDGDEEEEEEEEEEDGSDSDGDGADDDEPASGSGDGRKRWCHERYSFRNYDPAVL